MHVNAKIFLIVSFIIREKYIFYIHMYKENLEIGWLVFVDPSEVPGPSLVPFGRRATDPLHTCTLQIKKKAMLQS